MSAGHFLQRRIFHLLILCAYVLILLFVSSPFLSDTAPATRTLPVFIKRPQITSFIPFQIVYHNSTFKNPIPLPRNVTSECIVQPLPAPLPDESVPHIYDLFAAYNGTVVYFITQPYYNGKCANKSLVEDMEIHSFYGKILMCHFKLRKDTPTGALIDEELIYSRRVNAKPVVSGGTVIIRCDIPHRLQPYARNTLSSSPLRVELISLNKPEENTRVKSSLSAPVCQHPLVNLNTVYKPVKAYVSACVWITGDKYKRFHMGKPKNGLTDPPLYRIKEWVEYHIDMGIDHFYFYDNSREPYGRVWEYVRYYVHTGRVTYIHWRPQTCAKGNRQNQWSLENSCFKRFGEYNKYMIHFDVDEYVVPREGRTMLEVLKEYEATEYHVLGLREWRYAVCEGVERRNISMLSIERHACWKGTDIDIRKKDFVKPDKILTHQDHFYVNTLDGSSNRKRQKILNSTTELLLGHLRDLRHIKDEYPPETKLLLPYAKRVRELVERVEREEALWMRDMNLTFSSPAAVPPDYTHE